MNHIDVMKQALEALELSWKGKPKPELELKSIINIKKAIEKAEKQEPFGYIQTLKNQNADEIYFCSIYRVGVNDILVYTAPPQREWVGLTDDEIDEGQKHSWVAKQAFESAVWWAEEKLKEKNT